MPQKGEGVKRHRPAGWTADPPATAARRKHSQIRDLAEIQPRNLVVPVDAPHMWHAAMNSKACRLTVLGEHYRRLVAKADLMSLVAALSMPKFTIRCEGVTWKEGQELLEILKAVQGVETSILGPDGKPLKRLKRKR